MEEYENEEGLSLLQLIKVALKRKWVWIVSTLAFLLIGTLGVHFIYNRQSEEYNASFYYDIPSLERGTYLNGAKFDYREIFSEDNLKRIQDENQEDFASIDIKNLADEVKLVRNSEVNNQNEITYSYNLSVPKKYFVSFNQGRDFIEKMIYTPYDLTLKYAEEMDYSATLNLLDQIKDFDSQVEILNNQLLILEEAYLHLENDYSNVLVESSLRINDYAKILNLRISEDEIKALLSMIRKDGIINPNDSEYVSKLELQKEALTQEKAANDEQIKSLNAAIDDQLQKAQANGLTEVNLDAYYQKIAELTSKNAEIDVELTIIDSKLAHENDETQDYKNKVAKVTQMIASYRSILSDETKQFENVQKVVATNFSLVYVNNETDIIDEDGGMNIILAMVIFALLGFVIGACINLVLDRKMLSPAKNKEGCQISDDEKEKK